MEKVEPTFTPRSKLLACSKLKLGSTTPIKSCCAALTCTAGANRKLRVLGCDAVGAFLNFRHVNPVEFFQR
jgi:hypothetical protein